MRRIDSETVQKILDTAEILDVVSDFVSLKRRGANYIGLCPFHNERTPSFSVSPSKGICKCFSCGKGGSPVGFLMELEQMSYSDALRYLAKKYNIEIKEREMDAEERERESERESLLAVNEFAMKHFEHNLTATDEGRSVGLAYFRERGINDAMVKRFHLGYSPDSRDDLFRHAKAKGFSEKFLIATGLCYKTERGTVGDRFRGRVIYPVFSLSGKVLAFGGRTLRKDKDVAKYVNSPESVIYRKSFELYGLYQAKQSIVRNDKCILVEGYMDVISMHQSGVENVVASSGTSLTEGQIRLIHRFTENVTVIYDSDPAGIKASLRGIDLLLAEGLNIKVMLLPEGEDPDSFAQSHTSEEVERYLADNEQDFISFKTSIMMKDTANDPIAKAHAIQSIVRSISVIPDPITRTVYIAECARSMAIDEKILTLQVAKYAAEAAEKRAREEQRERNRAKAGLPADPAQDAVAIPAEAVTPAPEPAAPKPVIAAEAGFLVPYERELVRYIVRYGLCYLCDVADERGDTRPMNVLEYVMEELRIDEISFSDPVFARLLDECLALAGDSWTQACEGERLRLSEVRRRRMEEGYEHIRRTAGDLASIQTREKELEEAAENEFNAALDSFAELYLQRQLLSCSSDEVRRTATALVTSRHSLSKIHTKYSHVSTERERLPELVPLAVYNLKCALIECEIARINKEIARIYSTAPSDSDTLRSLMQRNLELNALKKEFAKYLGERILSPHRP